jgi:hypothetical protein
LERLLEAHGKESHADALASAARLRRLQADGSVRTRLFAADATDAVALRAGLAGIQPDVVLADVPYGRLTSWSVAAADPVAATLDAIAAAAPGAAVGLVGPKQIRVRHAAFTIVERFSLGVRRAYVLVQ